MLCRAFVEKSVKEGSCMHWVSLWGVATFTGSLTCWKELEEVAAPVVSGLTFVVAVSGSGFSEVPEVGAELSLAVPGLPGPSIVTAVVAASGLGFDDSLSGALWLPTGSIPAPEGLVLPSGFGWIGDELNARQQIPWCATRSPAKGLHAWELKATVELNITEEAAILLIKQAVHQEALKLIVVPAHLQRLGSVMVAATPACLDDADCEIAK